MPRSPHNFQRGEWKRAGDGELEHGDWRHLLQLVLRPGSTVTTAGGTKVTGVASPNTVSSLSNGTQYAFIATAVNSWGKCGERGDDCYPIGTRLASRSPHNFQRGEWKRAGDGELEHRDWGHLLQLVLRPREHRNDGGRNRKFRRCFAEHGQQSQQRHSVCVHRNGGEQLRGERGERSDDCHPLSTGIASGNPHNFQCSEWKRASNGELEHRDWGHLLQLVLRLREQRDDGERNKVAGVASPNTVGSLNNGTQYAFIVTAVNSDGESVASNIVVATPVAGSGRSGQRWLLRRSSHLHLS